MVCVGYATADKWAVLVAGSSSFYNYRHQADICHAYQIFHENGFPDSNIIVMMYDDIAYSAENPFPGVIINKNNGNNLYVNVPKDYTGNEVTPQNFLNVLIGNSTDGKKVVVPNPDNDIFIYFADHGASGLIAFPTEFLYAYQLIDTFKYMYNNKQYNSIVFYLEACESGSMFNNLLPSNMSIFAMTAANPDESSYACCYDPVINIYLGDLFSVNWLENSDSFEAVANETFSKQFLTVKAETNTSSVCVYGDLSLMDQSISSYMVYEQLPFSSIDKNVTQKNIIRGVTNSRNVKMDILMKKYDKSDLYTKIKVLGEMQRELQQRQLLEKLYTKNTIDYSSCYPREYIDSHCVQKAIEIFVSKYGQIYESNYDYIRNIVANCIVSV